MSLLTKKQCKNLALFGCYPVSICSKLSKFWTVCHSTNGRLILEDGVNRLFRNVGM